MNQQERSFRKYAQSECFRQRDKMKIKIFKYTRKTEKKKNQKCKKQCIEFAVNCDIESHVVCAVNKKKAKLKLERQIC